MKEKKYFKHALALTPCTHSQGACLGNASFKGDVASPRLASPGLEVPSQAPRRLLTNH
jgi:hypothetical protein